MFVCVCLQSDVVCLGTAPESFTVEIHTESTVASSIGPCSFNNNSNISCGMSTLHSQDGHLTRVLNLSDYLRLNQMYWGQIGVKNSAGIAMTSIEICEYQFKSDLTSSHSSCETLNYVSGHSS